MLAAADFLAKQPYVDPARIYLGGHSTGGTLALLVAESTDRFRAVFSFGPADDVTRLPGPSTSPLTPRDRARSRAALARPLAALDQDARRSSSRARSGGNIDSLQTMARTSTNPKAHFFAVRGADHFSILAPTNRLVAEKILKDEGPETNLASPRPS